MPEELAFMVAEKWLVSKGATPDFGEVGLQVGSKRSDFKE